ncbi:MoxR family ATPase [Eubacterium sp.]|uniref:AAA family ATPase n=1 Tax=Eubacterium sp. TaxID=142586 RepID=UPI000E8977DA|nr:MoxR family ATPase [Eubacterium sp.]MCR5629318.1 MoxR family ATPase [Eubacterium sp.]HAV91350.1 AAA family ATPase [Eubacterium sp.]
MNGYEVAHEIIKEVNKVIIGKEEVVKKVLTCFLAGGHILIDDIPGVGKTTMAIAFAKAMNLEQNRIQFTSDVMPSDVVGFTIFDQAENEFKYKPGVIFCNLLLADEINRTSAKTQSALLEAMEEKKVTVDGVSYKLNNPFMVIATQNPEGSVGTHMLPESQLDRFMIRLSIGYPKVDDEINMLKTKEAGNSLDNVVSITDPQTFANMQKEVSEVFIHDRVYKYMVDIVSATRKNNDIKLGASPRGSVALAAMSRAYAYLEGRNYVIPDDVIAVVHDTLGHRLVMNMVGGREIKSRDAIDRIISQVIAPVSEG